MTIRKHEHQEGVGEEKSIVEDKIFSSSTSRNKENT
jgi:hypothetical protein